VLPLSLPLPMELALAVFVSVAVLLPVFDAVFVAVWLNANADVAYPVPSTPTLY